jgi:phage terminase large subunit-like protein
MPTPAELHAATVAALQAEASADLAVLQTGLAVVTNPASTIADCEAAIATMKAGLADPTRAAAVQGLSDGWGQLVDGLQTLISTTNAATTASS